MEEKMTASFQWKLVDSSAIKSDNVLVQVTTLKLTKENYIHWDVVIIMENAGRNRIDYINGRQQQPKKI